MAKVEDILKTAVETEDWLLACNLYTQMTGKPLSPPSLLKLDEDFEDEVLTEEEPRYKVGEIVLYQSPSGKKLQECEVLEVIDSLNYAIKMKQNGRKYTVNVEEISVNELEEIPAEEPVKNESEDFMVSTRDTKHSIQENDVSGVQMKTQAITAPKRKQYLGTSNKPFEDTLSEGLVDEQGNTLLQTEAQRKARKAPARGERSMIGGSDTNQIVVECSICEHTFSIAPSLAIGYIKDRPGTPMHEKQNTYKCNDCNSRKGRAKQARENRENQLVRKRRG